MASQTLYQKIWNLHKIATLPTGQDHIFIGLHYLHEVTSPQAFSMLREAGATVAYPDRTFATIDHVIPTDNYSRPFADAQAELMAATLEQNAREFGITLFDVASGHQGVVHIIGPELGITQPGMTIVVGDSHTATHGAFGSLAFGIGTTEVGHVLRTQSLALAPLKVRNIRVNGALSDSVYAKDVILAIIRQLGVKGGLGYAYEYSGDTISQMPMDDRMTICNMSIEGGARIGYINPDDTTIDYLRGRAYSPTGAAFDRLVDYWRSIATDSDAAFDDVVTIDATQIDPMVTWGITPAQAIGITETLPDPDSFPEDERAGINQAYAYMGFSPKKPILGTPIDVVFIGSCTNGRITDLRIAAERLRGKQVAKNIKCLVVPGSHHIKKQAEAEGLDAIFNAAGAEWRDPGCSMCLAMNPDKLIGNQLSVSTSNRNFMGRQGSTTGRTVLASPATAAASAVAGCIADPRE